MEDADLVAGDLRPFEGGDPSAFGKFTDFRAVVPPTLQVPPPPPDPHAHARVNTHSHTHSLVSWPRVCPQTRIGNLFASTPYVFVVEALSTIGVGDTSKPSDPIMTRLPEPPPQLRGLFASDVTPVALALHWALPDDDNGADIITYRAQRQSCRVVHDEDGGGSEDDGSGEEGDGSETGEGSSGDEEEEEEEEGGASAGARGAGAEGAGGGAEDASLGFSDAGDDRSLTARTAEEAAAAAREPRVAWGEWGSRVYKVRDPAASVVAVKHLRPAGRYRFRARAENTVGPGAWSEALEVTTPDAAAYRIEQRERENALKEKDVAENLATRAAARAAGLE